MYQRISAEEYETIIQAIKNELAFIRRNYGDSLIEELEKLVDRLSEVDYIYSLEEVTTPFSDDLGIERHDYYNQRELGEVHDTFNVEIRQGNGNPITLTRQVIRCSQDDGSYLQSMVDVLSKLRN